MNIRSLLIILLLFCFTSCRTILLHSTFNNPQVETSESIKNFQIRNNFSTENSLILKSKANENEIFKNLMSGMSIGFYIFDQNGNLICYNGSSTCSGTQFKELLNNDTNSFNLCKNDSIKLKEVLDNTIDLMGVSVNINSFPKSDYYVIRYWGKFVGGERGYREEVDWMEKEINNVKTKKTITFIKINSDLQENWGLIAGKKAKLKITTKEKNIKIRLVDIPYKK